MSMISHEQRHPHCLGIYLQCIPKNAAVEQGPLHQLAQSLRADKKGSIFIINPEQFAVVLTSELWSAAHTFVLHRMFPHFSAVMIQSRV